MALNLEQKKRSLPNWRMWPPGAFPGRRQYSGLTVEQLTDLRRKAQGWRVPSRGEEHPVRRAVQGTDYECVSDALAGPMLFAFSKEDPVRQAG
jgi:large subunit ribosomal protein L10